MTPPATTNQPALFPVEPLPTRRRRAAPNDEARAAADAWTAQVLDAIEATARAGHRFQAHDLVELHNLPEPQHHNQWGRAFALAHRIGIIEPVHAARSTRRTTCGSLCWVWEATPELLGRDTLPRAA